MSPSGYQAPAKKASQCGNERQERRNQGSFIVVPDVSQKAALMVMTVPVLLLANGEFIFDVVYTDINPCQPHQVYMPDNYSNLEETGVINQA